MRYFDMFSRRQIGERAYVVSENYLPGHRCTVGVFEGTDSTLVIDTGLGLAGNLRKYIETFTKAQKPMICVCTHGHTDCVGGIQLFDKVYLSRADIKAHPESFDKNFCLMQLGMWTNNAAEIAENAKRHMAQNDAVAFEDLTGGESFALGGVIAEVTAFPGHTEGSAIVRVTQNNGKKYSFCGDAFSAELNHFHTMSGKELLTYSDELTRLAYTIGEDEPVFSAHSPEQISREIALSMAQSCREVAEGNIENDPPFDFGFKKADGQLPDLRVHFTNNVYIVYDADLI